MRLFSYWLAGIQEMNLLSLADQDAQGFLAVLQEYRAHGGRR